MVNCDNFKQLRTQCFVYRLQMVNTFGLHAIEWWQISTDVDAPKSI